MTQPLENENDIKLILNYLKKKNKRNYLIFKLQLKTALRISDILNIKLSNFLGNELVINEKKTGKTKRIILDELLFSEIKKYIKKNKISNFLFIGKKKTDKPISRIQAFRIIKKVAKDLNIENLSTHTFRKTTAYFLYKNTNDISLVMKLLNHSSEATTLLYLGITQNKINNHLHNLFNF